MMQFFQAFISYVCQAFSNAYTSSFADFEQPRECFYTHDLAGFSLQFGREPGEFCEWDFRALTNLYLLFGINSSASPAVVRSTTREALARCHPDLFPPQQQQRVAALFQEMQLARNCLIDNDMRERYNQRNRYFLETYDRLVWPRVNGTAQRTYACWHPPSRWNTPLVAEGGARMLLPVTLLTGVVAASGLVWILRQPRRRRTKKDKLAPARPHKDSGLRWKLQRRWSFPLGKVEAMDAATLALGAHVSVGDAWWAMRMDEVWQTPFGE